jgi:hypothetical protein
MQAAAQIARWTPRQARPILGGLARRRALAGRAPSRRATLEGRRGVVTSQDRTREAARALVAGDAGAMSDLLDVCFEQLDRVIRWTVGPIQSERPGGAEALVDEIVERFLVAKLRDERFLGKVVEAASPVGLILQAAKHFALDVCSRERRPTEELTDGRLDLDAVAPEASIEALVDTTSAVRAAAVLDALSPDDLLLAKVLFVERCGVPLPRADVAVLASRRGVTAAQIDAELRQRAERQWARRAGSEDRRSTLQAELVRLQAAHNAAEALIRSLDPEPAEPATRAVAIKTTPLPSMLRKLEGATPSERQRFLENLEARIEQTARLYQQASLAANETTPDGPGYEEVARILGELHEDADPEERKRVVNRVTRRAKRLALKARSAEDRPADEGWKP